MMLKSCNGILLGIVYHVLIHSTTQIYAQLPFPANDQCSNATVIPSSITTLYTTEPVSIRFATEAVGEPVTQCGLFLDDPDKPSDGASLWYTFTPAVTGSFQFNTDGSFIDEEGTFAVQTTIGVYQGNTCTTLTELDCTDPSNRLRPTRVVAGRKYYIKVGTRDNVVGGKLVLNVKPTFLPPNAECISAITIDPVAGGTVSGSLADSIVDENAVEQCTYSKGLWYKVTNSLPVSLAVSASTCTAESESEFGSGVVVSVHKGTDCKSLFCAALDYFSSGECYLRGLGFVAEPQSTYYIAVQSFDDLGGANFTLKVSSTQDYFELYNSELDEVIEIIGDTIGSIGSPAKLNIRAVFGDATTIQSVQVTFDDPETSFCEEFAPYSIFRDKEGDYYDEAIPVGSHTVTATAYSQDGCSGTQLKSISKTFEMLGCDIGYSILEPNLLCYVDGLFQDSLNELDSLPCDVNIEIYTYTCDPRVVDFELRNLATNRVISKRKEKFYPFLLFGDDLDTGVYNSGTINAGTYNLTVSLDGIKQTPVTFKVANQCDPNYQCSFGDDFPTDDAAV